MVMPEHICPYGLKARHLLRSQGYAVDDHWLRTREETDAFKASHKVATTPQTFFDDQRIGTYDDLRRFFGKRVADPDVPSYRPVITVFICALLMALAALIATPRSTPILQALEWFIAFSMCILALLKLQDVESFSTMFLNYDLLARRWVPYAYLYPFAEFLAGALMISGRLSIVSIPIALFIGGVGAISVIKAVYVDHRELKCACVGGASNVPLGFVSLTENLMMVAMSIWMTLRHVL
ncbi:MAG: glutaredoxin [Proteobacteria bacterium]|nr:MAG: glutaredoxin [Pseudomonadota bacterium]